MHLPDRTRRFSGARALFLPEASDYIAGSAQESLSLARTPECSAFVVGIRDAAKKHGIAVNVGVHEPATEREREQRCEIRSETCLCGLMREGKLTQRYQKIHLFDVELGGGSPPLKRAM